MSKNKRLKMIDLTTTPQTTPQTALTTEATMFALFAFKVLMGENKMRQSFLNASDDFHFPESIGNKGTFATINTNWNNKLTNFLNQAVKQRERKRWIMTVITPPANPNEGSHYLSLVIDTKRKRIYTFDSLLSSKQTGSVLNNYEIYVPWKPIKTRVQKWADSNTYTYYYLASPTPWQNTSNEQDAWCQTWALLFQKKVIDGKWPKQISHENVTVKEIRSELMELIKTTGTSEFERELESEYQAQLGVHGADPGMKVFRARELINDAKYRHFFEPYMYAH